MSMNWFKIYFISTTANWENKRMKQNSRQKILMKTLMLMMSKKSIRHIKGHQDDIQRFESLSRWSQLNFIVDGNAKHRLAQYFYSKNKVPISRYHKEEWTCCRSSWVSSGPYWGMSQWPNQLQLRFLWDTLWWIVVNWFWVLLNI